MNTSVELYKLIRKKRKKDGIKKNERKKEKVRKNEG